MPVRGKIIRKFLSLMNAYSTKKLELKDVHTHQEKILKKLLNTAKNTDFGIRFDFKKILAQSDVRQAYQTLVPLYDYELYNDEWMEDIIQEKKNVCWPGQIKYFALTSGTSSASSKRIPISNEMKKSMMNTSLKHFYTLKYYDLPDHFFEKEMLLLGGSTHLTKIGRIQEGDLSGIMARDVPVFINGSTRPGKDISMEKSWDAKIERIVAEAPKWDIGLIAGVPSWLLLLIDKILDRYEVSNIHEIWPNFSIFAHGGTSIIPYVNPLKERFGKSVHFSETYLASEGFFAYQKGPDRGMSLNINENIYYEFIPYNNKNFRNGDLTPDAQSLNLSEVKLEVKYALVISTASGLWRYIPGDIIEFTDLENLELKITGRTKHFVNLCGEHLTVENLDEAVRHVSSELNINIREYTFYPYLKDGMHFHQWYLGVDQPMDSSKNIAAQHLLDEKLKAINDDYNAIRGIKINEVRLDSIPMDLFYDWMSQLGKSGGQNKFPRVLNNEQHLNWKNFLSLQKVNFSRNQIKQ